MAKTYTAKDIRLIINFEFDPELQTLIYKLALNSEKEPSKKVKSHDIDEQFLNGAEWNELMKNITGLPKNLASHEKLLKFMKSTFYNGKKTKKIFFFVKHRIDDVEESALSYTEFIMKPEFVTGIPLKELLTVICKAYVTANIVMDSSLEPSPDKVKTYIFVN